MQSTKIDAAVVALAARWPEVVRAGVVDETAERVLERCLNREVVTDYDLADASTIARLFPLSRRAFCGAKFAGWRCTRSPRHDGPCVAHVVGTDTTWAAACWQACECCGEPAGEGGALCPACAGSRRSGWWWCSCW